MAFLIKFKKPLALTTLLLAGLFLSACGEKQKVLKVGSKPFTESIILAEMVAQAAENEGITVERNLSFGPTQTIMEATKQGIIDLYPEYNGTSLIFLGQAPTSDGKASTETVQKLFQPLGLEMVGKFGFSNDYALVMSKDRAQALGVSNLGDLANLEQPVTFSVEDDFLKRADGLQQMVRRYGITDYKTEVFPFSSSDSKDNIAASLLSGSADVGEFYMTDGQIAEYDLAVLKDNLGFFPVYQAASLVRSDTLAALPALKEVLGKMESLITAEDMQAMNKSVDIDAQDPAAVAKAFLAEKGILPEDTKSSAAEKLPVAVPPGTYRSAEISKALRAIRAGFSGSSLELGNTPDPLASLANGEARVAIVGAESFFEPGADAATRKDNTHAFATLGYQTGHLLTQKQGAGSITDMKRIATGPEGSRSAQVLAMILNSLALNKGVEVINGTGDNLAAQVKGLAGGQYDGVFVMRSQGDRELGQALQDNTRVALLGLNEWADGGHTAKYSFIRPATVAADTYPAQSKAVASISTQTVLASPVEQAKDTGEVGPGTAGDAATAIPVTAEAVEKINKALGETEIIDPTLPIHTALLPKIDVVDKSLPFRLDISIVNILMILFLIWVIYLVTLPSPRDFTMPDDL